MHSYIYTSSTTGLILLSYARTRSITEIKANMIASPEIRATKTRATDIAVTNLFDAFCHVDPRPHLSPGIRDLLQIASLTECLRGVHGLARSLEVPVAHQAVVASRQQASLHMRVPAQAIAFLAVSLAPVLRSTSFRGHPSESTTNEVTRPPGRDTRGQRRVHAERTAVHAQGISTLKRDFKGELHCKTGGWLFRDTLVFLCLPMSEIVDLSRHMIVLRRPPPPTPPK